MKKWIFAFVLIVVTIFAGVFYFRKSTPKPPDKVLSAIENPTATLVWKQSTVIDIDGVPIRISWALVNPENVELYSNLKEQKLSEEIKVNKSCQTLVNGGFYSEDLKHLGLFVADFEEISQPIRSDLLSGFLWINTDNKVKIGKDMTDNSPRLALQTGPLLMQDGQPLPLAINNDEPARRIAAGTTANNQLIFMVFYREQSELEGPLLGNLPEIIGLFKKQTGINIADAINLDGGSASVFISNYDLIRELAIMGSYFCAK